MHTKLHVVLHLRSLSFVHFQFNLDHKCNKHVFTEYSVLFYMWHSRLLLSCRVAT